MINTYLKIFNNKKVLVTGHTGFKGSWLTLCLKKLNANILGLSKDFSTNPSHYKVCKDLKKIRFKKFNICKLKKLQKTIKDYKPNFIFHLAAQSLVRKSYKSPIETWMSNTFGTINILDCLKNYNEKICVVIITSDKVYKNVEKIIGYKESDILGGDDPYSASKAAAELAIKSYFNTYLKNNGNVSLAVARAGNVVGGGDWSKDRIIPDCIRAWSKNKKVVIRNPESTRPWQHVLESVFGYIVLAGKLKLKKIKNGEIYNFGPSSNKNYKVIDCLNEIKKNWNNVSWEIKKEKKIFNEAGLLNLNSSKAFKDLNWKNILSFSQVMKMTADWYKSYYHKKSTIISNQQIDEYLNLLISKRL
jgi:CDP-glucose 4,6-dehydratase